MEFLLVKQFPFMLQIILACFCIFLASALLTWFVRIYALRHSIIDIPNERSSHQVPMPRAGGIAIVITFIFSLLGLYQMGFIESYLVWALIGGGVVVAIAGYCDDVFSLKPRVRLLLHLSAAIWAVYWLHGFPILDMGTTKFSLHGWGSLLAITGIIWCINFYNFMDGIDGLAGSQGMFIGLAAGLALCWVDALPVAILMWLLSAAIGGFTIWNWPPAKIFLGDVGSGFLGFVFGTLGIYTTNKGFLPFSFWFVVSAVFFCDATFTLIYRVSQGKKWYSAHREHAYQHLIFCGRTHKQVTMNVVILNCVLLLPIAFIILYQPFYTLWLLGAAVMSLSLIWIWIKSRRISNF